MRRLLIFLLLAAFTPLIATGDIWSTGSVHGDAGRRIHDTTWKVFSAAFAVNKCTRGDVATGGTCTTANNQIQYWMNPVTSTTGYVFEVQCVVQSFTNSESGDYLDLQIVEGGTALNHLGSTYRVTHDACATGCVFKWEPGVTVTPSASIFGYGVHLQAENDQNGANNVYGFGCNSRWEER